MKARLWAAICTHRTLAHTKERAQGMLTWNWGPISRSRTPLFYFALLIDAATATL